MITDENHIPGIITELLALDGAEIEAGWIKGKTDSEMVNLASIHEFGAVIRSKKAIAKLWYPMKEAGLIDPKHLPLQVWMRKKTEIVIPERAPLRTAADDPRTHAAITEACEDAISGVFTGLMTAQQGASRIGQVMEDAIRLFPTPVGMNR